MKLSAVCILLLPLLVPLVACDLSDEQKNQVDAALGDPAENVPPTQTHPPLEALCKADTYQQPQAEITKKVDVLFVVDSSGSLRDERTAIADGIDALIAALPTDVDYHLGVMMSHVGEWCGKPYAYNDGLPEILKSNEMTLDQIRPVLRGRMRNTLAEAETDGGEAGLYSLFQALHGEKLSYLREQGMFRDDAALIVVFVADENDICATYPAGVNPMPDISGKEALAKVKYCAGITPEAISARLREVKANKPIVAAGVLYHERSQFNAEDENEIGYGYIEVIDQLNGAKIDLAGGQLNLGLEQIGNLATKKLNLRSEFPMQLQYLDTASIQVKVDGQTVPYQYLPEINEVHLTAYLGGENSEVYIRYCQQDPETPVVISNLSITQITTTTARVCWQTDLPSTSQVRYTRLASGVTNYTAKDTILTRQHCQNLTGLVADSLYSIRAISAAVEMESISNEFRFRTGR